MTHLRRVMLEELQRRNYATTVIDSYIRAVEQFAKHFKLRHADARFHPVAVREGRQLDPIGHGHPSEARLAHDRLRAVAGGVQPFHQVEVRQLHRAPPLCEVLLLLDVPTPVVTVGASRGGGRWLHDQGRGAVRHHQEAPLTAQLLLHGAAQVALPRE